MRPVKRKNETLCYKALCELLPETIIEREVRINERVIDNGEIVRYYIVVDFMFKLNGNTIVEFHGGQHFKSVKKWGGKNALRKQKLRDEFLRGYCKNNHINLIEVDGRKIRGKKIKRFLKKTLKPYLKPTNPCIP